ncbi:ADP-ribosylglycohydrolase family protein [Streptomyces sp. NBC_01497]|uniref:ADP-ribosylglycohydrolase family protein n=1 Tax=Streptomyces sp. NBC_01497 TaxID=2903885 RepID=UPI002E3129D5|nr:ADP-ribosylglycohydrolase family protein [Streptomyces sp. NBC_01497]
MSTLWGRAEQLDFRSRVRGCLLGGGIGDALGAGASGAVPEPGSLPEEVDLVPAYGRRGAVTWATQLTLFTADGLIRAQISRDRGHWHPPTDVHRACLRWYATQRDWGPDERRADNGWLAMEEWLYARRDPALPLLLGLGDEVMGTRAEPKNPRAADPGAVLRSAPFGLLVGWEPELVGLLAAECAVHTHGHPAACLSASAYAVIVHGLARRAPLEAAVGAALKLLAAEPGHEPVTAALTEALQSVRAGVPDVHRVAALGAPGGAENALAVAVYCALVAEDLRHGLSLATAGPTARAAAPLCGALLGTWHGETALPPLWLAELEGRGTLLELADDFAMELTQSQALHGGGSHEAAWLRRYPCG